MMNHLPGTRRNLTIAEILVWVGLTLVALAFIRVRVNPPLSNDGYQYLSVASNFLRDHSLSTSLVYFDSERAHGQIPAPLTTFPPGYSLAIAGLRPADSRVEDVGRLISQVSQSLVSGLLIFILATSGLGFLHRQLMMLFWVANATVLDYGASVWSEPLFTLLFVGAVGAYIWVEYRCSQDRSFFLPALVAAVAASLTCWVRYAGYFVIAALFIYALIQWVRFRNRQRTLLLAFAVVPVLSAVCLMLRNIALAGTWKGGNELEVHNRLIPLFLNYVILHVHLLLGSHAVTFGVWEGIFAIGTVVLCVGLLIVFRGSDGTGRKPLRDRSLVYANSLLLVLTCTGIYSLSMWYVGIHTAVSFGDRMFLPLLPLYVLLFALLILAIDHRAQFVRYRAGTAVTAGLVLVALGYMGINARDLGMLRRHDRAEALAAAYALPGHNGQPVIDWFQQELGPYEAILTEESQATGYVLGHPTVGMITPEYSAIRWDCDTVRNTLTRFDMRYVVLYRTIPSLGATSSSPTASAAAALLPESRFVTESVAGHPPCDFEIAAESSAVVVLRSKQPTQEGGLVGSE